jgi:cytochrome bd-type quinol oxidase subunit 2
MKKTILSIMASFALLLAPTVMVAGVSVAQIDKGIQATCTGANCPTSAANAESKANQLVKDIINIFSWIVGVVSVIMIIFGGFKYITSGGDAGKVTSAKNTILYALVGLVIVALAQAIVWFVLGAVTKPAPTP